MQIRSLSRPKDGETERALAPRMLGGPTSLPHARRPDPEGGLARPDGGLVVASSTTARSPATHRFPSPNPMYAGSPGLFMQTMCTARNLAPALELVRREELGLILTRGTRSSNVNETLRRAVEDARQMVTDADTATLHVLADANRYSGKNREYAKREGGNLTTGWITTQRDLGMPITLTDSPYIAAKNRGGLTAVLREARDSGADAVVLPLHLDWLTKDVGVLLEEVNGAGVPIALVLEHSGDPLGLQRAVAGLVRLLEAADVKVALLRSDLSVIGAIAFGATFGAVGTTTGMRHLYPHDPEKTGGFNREPSIGVYVPRSMAYRSLEKLLSAMALDQEHDARWRCSCSECYNRPLSWIVDEVQAYQHSLTAIGSLGADVLSGPTALHRKHAWVGRCRTAQTTNHEISDETGMPWDPPDFQGAWGRLVEELPPIPTGIV